MRPTRKLPLLRAKDLRKNFGAVEVLRGIGFHVLPGETVCIWGPSGAGKSTLLHILGLMTPPTEGEFELFGKNVRTLSDNDCAVLRNERIGFLFQFHYLLPDLSLLENVMIPLLIRRIPRDIAQKRAQSLLDRLGLRARRHHRPSESSGGEQQRAALARALAGEPSLLLADEPTGNLDRSAGKDVERLMKSEVKSRETALVLVTHNEALAAQADRRLTLIDGRLEGK